VVRSHSGVSLQGEAWEVSQSVSHGGSLPYNWMVEPSIVGASAGVLHANPADFLQLFRTEAVSLRCMYTHTGARNTTVLVQKATMSGHEPMPLLLR
jgi:hypothetical protein